MELKKVKKTIKRIFNAASFFSYFEIQRYHKNQSKLNGVYSRYNLPKTIKDGAYVIKLDEYSDIGTH